MDQAIENGNPSRNLYQANFSNSIQLHTSLTKGENDILGEF